LEKDGEKSVAGATETAHFSPAVQTAIAIIPAVTVAGMEAAIDDGN
jgi:hypothetical protein